MKRKPSYLWIIFFMVLFPFLQLLFFLLRFHRLPINMLYESAIFVPIGLIAGTVLIFFLRREDAKVKKRKIIIMFLIAIPFAVLFSLLGGLINTSPIFIGIIGSMPLILGILWGVKLSQ